MRRFLLRHRKLRLALAKSLSALACIWRRLMFRTTFIAVTGSLGKTTATRCLHGLLSSCYPISWAHGRNSRFDMASAILRTRPRHRFTLIEVGTTLPGALRRTAWTLAPDTAVDWPWPASTPTILRTWTISPARNRSSCRASGGVASLC